MQHRGQEACGIAASDDTRIECVKNKGLISEVFNTDIINALGGTHAIGHVRYSTAGSNVIENVQPIIVRAHQGEFCVVHNGQIVNAQELKVECEKDGSIFQGSSDSEIIARLLKKS